ncbi:hypothetical protein RB620_04375 [Paenibacillus sp. LHD-117]|uniref:hypothetical protein n=1 Tax=Paenibacillus sp. LHD-117 TaxID=3071412 RepID=UPI0027E0E97C|nr:hypothetical protein [Paenibacillus sp. LHD-117]MDQ6418668.1 hypothetical protein [Paenibacillus sp. LHD-117]
MSTWNSPPQIPAFKSPPFGADPEQVQKSTIEYLKQLANIVSSMTKDLEHMINGNLDVKNIRAKGITADRMDVDELSAISANLGHIIAGLIESVTIIGAYIATAQGTYPRAEMSSAEDLFAAYATADNYLKIFALESGTPMIYFNNLISTARLFLNGGNLSLANFGTLLLSAISHITIESTNPSSNINLVPGTSGSVKVPSWGKIFSEGDAQSLATAINNLAAAISAKATSGASTSSAGAISLNGGIPPGTQLLKAGGGSVSWTGINIPDHTHTQS